MNVSYRAGDLDPSAKADLATRLTDVLIAMEGGADTRGGRAFAWVMFTEVAQDNWWIGGTSGDKYVAAPGRFLVHVNIPEGYMNGAHKSEVHRWINDAILAATGATGPDATGASVLVVIDEVPEGNWGCAGRTISLASIAESVGLSKTGERYAWVESYFGAKARMLAASGYPSDTGGVPPSMAAAPVSTSAAD